MCAYVLREIWNNFASFSRALTVVEIDSKAARYSPRFSLEMIIVTSDIVGADSVREPCKRAQRERRKEKELIELTPTRIVYARSSSLIFNLPPYRPKNHKESKNIGLIYNSRYSGHSL